MWGPWPFFLFSCPSRKWKVRKSSADPLNMVRRPMDVKKKKHAHCNRSEILACARGSLAPVRMVTVGKPPQIRQCGLPAFAIPPRACRGGTLSLCGRGGGSEDPQVSLRFFLLCSFQFFQSFALTVLCLLGSRSLGPLSLGPLFVLSKHTRWGDLAVCVRT